MDFKIRKITINDEKPIAELAFETYYKRFFCKKSINPDTGKVYGGPLAEEFPELKKGQNIQWFYDYWREFIKGVSEKNIKKRNYAYVAECNKTGKLLGFIKGNGEALEENIYKEMQKKQIIKELSREEICEMASIYISFDAQRLGVGSALMQAYTKTMQDLGYKTMVTRAYSKNDSNIFFGKEGAVFNIKCVIPNGYYDENGNVKSVDIPGVCMVWSEESFANMVKGKKASISLEFNKDRLLEQKKTKRFYNIRKNR